VTAALRRRSTHGRWLWAVACGAPATVLTHANRDRPRSLGAKAI